MSLLIDGQHCETLRNTARHSRVYCSVLIVRCRLCLEIDPLLYPQLVRVHRYIKQPLCFDPSESQGQPCPATRPLGATVSDLFPLDSDCQELTIHEAANLGGLGAGPPSTTVSPLLGTNISHRFDAHWPYTAPVLWLFPGL